MLNLLRNGEGLTLYKTILRMNSSWTSSTMSLESGIYLPLDSYYDSQKGKLYIYLPERLESCADSGLIQDLLRFATSFKSVEFIRINKEYNLANEEKLSLFFMGYITELLSNQKIERISYDKDSLYRQGRSCARAKILLSVIDQQKCPSKFLKIPERYLGGTAQWGEPEEKRVLRTYIGKDQLERVDTLLKNLTSLVVKTRREQVWEKIGENLFIPMSEFLHLHKRRVRESVKRRGKSVTQTIRTIDPTKPSQLATVAPWERLMVSELYEKLWNHEQELLESIKKMDPRHANYVDLGNKLTQIYNAQWDAKQEMLRRTKSRLAGYPGNLGDPLWKKLNWCRETLQDLATLESASSYKEEFNPYKLLPTQEIRVEKKPYSLSALHKEGKLVMLYPQTDSLLSEWDTYASRPAPNKGAD
jgi:hypothetical protein